MKNQFSLNIKTPCHENFNQFSQTPDGGFCGSCDKEVIDFTKMNTQDLVNYFQNQKRQNTCGRFNRSQLSTVNENHQQSKNLSLVGSFGLACIMAFSMNTIQAQESQNPTKTPINTQEVQNSAFQNSFIVKGNVYDNSEPLVGVNVTLEGTKTGTVTDFNGHFEFPIKLKKGDVLVFSYLGLESQKVVVENENSASNIALNVKMTLDTVVIMGKVAVKGLYQSKRNK